MLETLFKELLTKYSDKVDYIVHTWHDVVDRYSEAHRHYHTLGHLRQMIEELRKYPGEIVDMDTLMFSIFYHDSVYRPGRKDNVKKSAELMETHLSQSAFRKIFKCKTQILSTEEHTTTMDSDTQILLDIDLSILGQTPEHYTLYQSEIREEFHLFPGWVFRWGRRKKMAALLEREFIFQTDFFRTKYEHQARKNLTNEIKTQ